MRCWLGDAFGSGVEEMSLRLFSRPWVVVVYCQARMVGGISGLAIMVDLVDGQSDCYLTHGWRLAKGLYFDPHSESGLLRM